MKPQTYALLSSSLLRHPGAGCSGGGGGESGVRSGFRRCGSRGRYGRLIVNYGGGVMCVWSW